MKNRLLLIALIAIALAGCGKEETNTAKLSEQKEIITIAEVSFEAVEADVREVVKMFDDYDGCELYDIQLTDETYKTLESDEKITVSIPLSEKLLNAVGNVYYVYRPDTISVGLTKLEADVKDNKITFETDELGIYVVLKQEEYIVQDDPNLATPPPMPDIEDLSTSGIEVSNQSVAIQSDVVIKEAR